MAEGNFTPGDLFVAFDDRKVERRQLTDTASVTWDLSDDGEIKANATGTGGGNPTGTIIMWPTATPPTGYLICDGSVVDRGDYSDLFDVIGETFGIGDGVDTFNLPDMRGRVPVGVKASDGDFDAIGETGGAKTVTSTGSVAAPVFTGSALGTHSHGVGTYANVAASAGTPSGTNSAPTFTGAPLATHLHAVGTYDLAAISAGTPAGTISWPVTVPVATWPAGVPTFAGSALGTHSHGAGTYLPSAHAGTAVANHASHTHTYTEVPNHVHVENINTAITGGAIGWPALQDNSTSGSTATGVSTANPTGGVATGTTAGPSATLTHTVTQPDAHTMSGSSEAITAGTPAGTISWPAGVPTVAWPAGVPTLAGTPLPTHDHTLSGSSEAVTAGTPAGTVSAPTFTGDALGNHNHTFAGTSEAVSAGTPAGTNSAPAFTGNATSVVQPYLAINFCIKT